MPILFFGGRFFYICGIMKRIFYLLSIALIALVSCQGQEDKDVSLDGRWNAPRYEDTPNDYAVSLIFKGNKLDAYIIALGEHHEGTYTLVDNVINFNITKSYHAFSNVQFDDQGNRISYAWMDGDMDQETFELIPGCKWYGTDVVGDLINGQDMLAKFSFEVDGNSAKTDLFGMDLVFHKAK